MIESTTKVTALGAQPFSRADRQTLRRNDGCAARLQEVPGEPSLVVFDIHVLLGADLRALSWQDRRERLELVAQAFDRPLS
jgi:ATP-dependent DNA ligase